MKEEFAENNSYVAVGQSHTEDPNIVANIYMFDPYFCGLPYRGHIILGW